MHSALVTWREGFGWENGHEFRAEPNLVLFFGLRETIADGRRFQELNSKFPGAVVIGCSTGGQISGDEVSDDGVTAIALQFQSTTVRLARERIGGANDSRPAGAAIGRALQTPDLAGLFVLSDGLNVNGSELIAGIRSEVGPDVSVTGGLAGDGPDFQKTLVSANCDPEDKLIAAVGLYGSSVRIGHGCAGGWDVFGPRRRVTRSEGNVLFELDGEPALDLYIRYLGEEAEGLPGTALLFPLQVRDPNCPDREIVRTVLAVDRTERTMTFAGDVPQGWEAQLMRGNFDHLANGAADASRSAIAGSTAAGSDIAAILVSCIGRRLLMGQRVTDELEAAGAILGRTIPRIGFYSYGEISPHAASGMCELHNQTMTITTLAEATA